MEPYETIEERNRRLDRSRIEDEKERRRREWDAAMAPPPEHFVNAARQIIAAQNEPPREPAPADTHHADAAAASLARMQAATGMRTN